MYVIKHGQQSNKTDILVTPSNKYQITTTLSKKVKQSFSAYEKKKKITNLKFLKIQQINSFYIQNYTIFVQQLLKNDFINIYIQTTLNNMFITISIQNKLITKSLAAIGFKGKSKQTSYAYKTFAELLITELNNLSKIHANLIINIYAKSINHKLKTFLKILTANNIKINKIYDTTPIPYNGCRKKKISIKKKKKSMIKYLSYR